MLELAAMVGPGPVDSRELDRQEASKAAAKSGEKFDEVQREVRRDRAAFFEKFALLNGGALVLGVSLLSYISGHASSVMHFVLTLHAAWGLLLVGLLAAIFRNLLHQHYLYDTAFSWYARDIAQLKRAEARLVAEGNVLLVDKDHRPADRVEYASELEEKQKT